MYIVKFTYVNKVEGEVPTTLNVTGIKMTLATGDKIQVYASTANLSFSAFGSEIA